MSEDMSDRESTLLKLGRIKFDVHKRTLELVVPTWSELHIRESVLADLEPHRGPDERGVADKPWFVSVRDSGDCDLDSDSIIFFISFEKIVTASMM